MQRLYEWYVNLPRLNQLRERLMEDFVVTRETLERAQILNTLDRNTVAPPQSLDEVPEWTARFAKRASDDALLLRPQLVYVPDVELRNTVYAERLKAVEKLPIQVDVEINGVTRRTATPLVASIRREVFRVIRPASLDGVLALGGAQGKMVVIEREIKGRPQVFMISQYYT